MAEPHDQAAPTQTLLLAAGQDCPGILDAITEHLSAQGGQVEEMKVTRLRGIVALVLLFTADADALERIRGGLPYLSERTEMDITLRKAGDASHATRTMRLVADGPREVHLLKEVSNLTRVLNVNITEASAEISTPGRQRVDLTIDLPGDVAPEKFHELLGQLLDHHGASWELVSM
ncbi:MAG: ACT domain-containing protein [Planctomycetota bacterium]